MRLLKDWWNKSKPSHPSRDHRPRVMPQVESLEGRDLMSASPSPVLMVIANQDFYYQEYADTRQSLEAAGLDVTVAAATTQTAIPHGNSGQGWMSGEVTPDLALASVNAADYSAIVFVGGWGSSMYQYAYNDPNLDGVTDNFYANDLYNGAAATREAVNELVNDFVAQDKYVCGLCHGVTVLAWARVDGASVLEGKRVAVPLTVGSPAQFYDGEWRAFMDPTGQYQQVIDNGGLALPVSGQYGDPTTVADDVVVDGRVITGENYDSARYFGGIIARSVLGDSANSAPQVSPAAWSLDENPPTGTVVGTVKATDPDAGQTLSYSIVGGNTNGAFTIDSTTGAIMVANAAAIDFESMPTFTLTVRAVDDGAGALAGFGEITINLRDVAESRVPPCYHTMDLVAPTTDPVPAHIDYFLKLDGVDGDVISHGRDPFDVLAGRADADDTTEVCLYCVCLEDGSTGAGIHVPIKIKHNL
jgi:putative intracellular protease/amidase